MFQFTTTTVINSKFEYGYTPTGVLDQDAPFALWSAQDSKQPSNMNIKRHLNFLKPNVVSITKAEFVPSKLAKATLDLSHLGKTEGSFRLAIYVKLAQSSANSYYANSLVFKGKPFYVEFVWKKDELASTVAARIKDTVKKYMLTVYEKELVKVTAEGSVVTITATDEYQRFEKVDIEEYIKNDSPLYGSFEVVKSAKVAETEGADENFVIEQGVEGFGTYQWILKNLRLPTVERTSWTAINADEAPIIGAKYNEFVIRYCTERGVMGGDAVGEVTKSLTTHVFYVNKEVSADFEAALLKIAPETGIESIPNKG